MSYILDNRIPQARRVESRSMIIMFITFINLSTWLKCVLCSSGSEEKIAHLRNLEGANERLKLVKADILDLSSILAVVLRGCEGVFHTACPVIPEITDPEVSSITNLDPHIPFNSAQSDIAVRLNYPR